MRPLVLALCAAALAAPLAAQQHEHRPGMQHPADSTPAAPTSPGQAAFGAIAEVVRLLDADPSTDWARVDLERLRAHLIDMDEVTLRAAVARQDVPGGARFTVTGAGRTVAAIQRMTRAHSAMLGAELGYTASVAPRADGAVLTVLARDPADARAVARLRALGLVGLLAEGGHHGPHHLALARGAMPAGHGP